MHRTAMAMEAMRRRGSVGGVRVKVSVPMAGYDLVWIPHPAAAFCTRESSTNPQQNSYRHTRRLHYWKAIAITFTLAVTLSIDINSNKHCDCSPARYSICPHNAILGR